MSTLASANIEFAGTTRQFLFRQQSSDEAIVKSVLVVRQYDFSRLARAAELAEFAQRAGANGRRPLIIDAGANIGAASLFFCVHYPRAAVVAIEPERQNFELLCRNVAGLDVETICGSMSPHAGRARVVDSGRGHWAFRTAPAAEVDAAAGTVPNVTINDIYRARGAGFFPFIVKIDIEGAESDVFAKNTDWVARTPIVMVELHDWLMPKAGTSRPFLQSVAAEPRDFIIVGENIFSISHSLYDAAYGSSDTMAQAT
jgi:FkbM family methyltransferase